MTLSIPAVAAIRTKLWAAGFRPVPILNADAPGPSPGKRPLAPNWRADALKDPPFCVLNPPVPFALNTGILADGLRAIDVDVDDEPTARQIRALAIARFGQTAVRFRANSPRCLLLYRAATGTPRKIALAGANRQKVEVLGAGQQFVAFGTHDSGADLEWSPEPPGKMELAALPAITETDVHTFLTQIAPLLGADAPPLPNGEDGARQDHAAAEAQANPLRVAAAMANIPNTGPANWERWNRYGMAIFAATAGSTIGAEIWNEWSRQHPSFDATETEARWKHYATSPPERIGAGTLFHDAGDTFQPAPELGEPPPEITDPGYLAALNDNAMSAGDWIEIEARQAGRPVPASREAREHAGSDVVWTIAEPWNEALIPTRPWIARGYLMRRAITVVSGPGSAGKSSLMVAWASAMALGGFFHRLKVTTRLRVATYNVEDDADEQKRRFSATLRKMHRTPEDVRDHLLILGPARVGTLLHAARDGSLLLNTPVLDRIEEHIDAFQPDVLMLDPFVELHQAEENDNTAIRAVMARFRAMAVHHDMAIVILHHARKGGANATPGDPDSLRGASSIVSAARIALTLNVMTNEEASTFGLPTEKRFNYFRLDRAKSNYAPITAAEWFERDEIKLENGSRHTEPDAVAVVWPWKPTNTLAEQDPAILNRALDLIQQGYEPGILFTASRRGNDKRWAGQILTDILDINDKQAAAMITEWLNSGLLIEVDYHHPSWRRKTTGVTVDDTKRPTISP